MPPPSSTAAASAMAAASGARGSTASTRVGAAMTSLDDGGLRLGASGGEPLGDPALAVVHLRGEPRTVIGQALGERGIGRREYLRGEDGGVRGAPRADGD